MENIKTVEEAISFLKNKRGTNVDDISKYRYKVYDEDFSCLMSSDKELIEYANEQKEGL